MKETHTPPQLPLDFEGEGESKRTEPVAKQESNVIFAHHFKRVTRSDDETDSVLEDVLSNARRLSW